MTEERLTRTFKTAAYEQLARVGKALSSGRRVELLDVLSHAPRTVEALANELGQSVANTSHHLQALKRAKLVRSDRDGLHVVYRLAGDDVVSLVDRLRDVANTHILELTRLTHDFFGSRQALEPVDQATLLTRLRRDDVVLIDVRSEQEFLAGHIPGAISLPLSELESRLDELPRHKTVVAYCRGPYCVLSADAARLLRQRGFEAARADVSAASWQVKQQMKG